MAIKKAYADVVEFLGENMSASVADVFDDVVAMCSAKSGGGGGTASTFKRDADGNITAIKCYYFGLWYDPSEVEFGKKATSATGFSSMTKVGTSLYARQQAAAKRAKDEILQRVAEGESFDVQAELAAIEAARVERDMSQAPEGALDIAE